MPRVIRKGTRRRRNTDTGGRAFTKEVVDAVWNKAKRALLHDANLYRRDACGNLIYRHAYGKESDMGWEVDHKKPVAKGGTDHLNNLQAMQSNLNAAKGDTWPWKCPN